jgi:hypothetical protein
MNPVQRKEGNCADLNTVLLVVTGVSVQTGRMDQVIIENVPEG